MNKLYISLVLLILPIYFQQKSHFEMGNIYLSEGRYLEALKEFEKALDEDPSNSAVNTLIVITKSLIRAEKEKQLEIANTYFKEEPGRALRAYKRILEIEPENKEVKEKITELEKVIKEKLPKLVDEAEVLIIQNKFYFAKEKIKEVLKYDPDLTKTEELTQKLKEKYIIYLKDKLRKAQGLYYNGSYNGSINILNELKEERLLFEEDTKEIGSLVFLFLGLANFKINKVEMAKYYFKEALNLNQKIELPEKEGGNILNIFKEVKGGK